MNKLIPVCALALGLPASLMANQAALNLELNGLDVEGRVINTDATRGPDATGVDLVRVTNNGDIEVLCELKPSADEPNMKASKPTRIEAGAQATLRLQGSYRDVESPATLACQPN